MTRSRALALFGNPQTEHGFCVNELCRVLKISRAAFYQWQDPIPEKRRLQLEKFALEEATLRQLAAYPVIEFPSDVDP